MIVEAVIGALVLFAAVVLVVRRSNIRTAQLRAYGHELWLDRYDELVRWAESVAYPDRQELVVAELSDDVARELFPERFAPKPVEVPARISTGPRTPEDVVGWCIADREHDWQIERQHVVGAEGFERVMHWCPECRQSFTEMVISGPPRAQLTWGTERRFDNLRQALEAKREELADLSGRFRQVNDGADGPHLEISREDYERYKAVVEQAKQIRELIDAQGRQLALSFSIPPAK